MAPDPDAGPVIDPPLARAASSGAPGLRVPHPAGPEFRGDCAACADLCCLALALDRGDAFAIDKPAGQPCPNLAPGGGCTIHATRARAGFPGCVAYDCAGAGQKVTAEVFGGADWRETPALTGPMMRAFSAMRRVQELRQVLAAALQLPLGVADRRSARDHFAALTPGPGGWTAEALEAAVTGPRPVQIDAFLRGLSGPARAAGLDRAGVPGDDDRG
ncbi:hypothetical protein EKE94_00450 [Mesobaculum littorinae]|uniref:Pentapeptide repeat-containing protein n=1 Tax=Mesobaculum littorinae TaxID=2486419 RepID=A0A438AKJ4_9RHOB|nr:hypothetical protein [Mesobaculum littorinae]RVV99202.1 hypothetical protein EKE94_00450 [Mesobaculum littorinae]